MRSIKRGDRVVVTGDTADANHDFAPGTVGTAVNDGERRVFVAYDEEDLAPILAGPSRRKPLTLVVDLDAPQRRMGWWVDLRDLQLQLPVTDEEVAEAIASITGQQDRVVTVEVPEELATKVDEIIRLGDAHDMPLTFEGLVLTALDAFVEGALE